MVACHVTGKGTVTDDPRRGDLPGGREVGTGFYASRTDPDRRRRNHVRQLEALGYTVILERAA